MSASSFFNTLRRRPQIWVELPVNFLRTAFETTNATLYKRDDDIFHTPASTMLRDTIGNLGINAIYETDDRRCLRVNQQAASAIFTESKSHNGQAQSTATFALTQGATPRPNTAPYLDASETVPVFVFSGQYIKDNNALRFICTSIHHKTKNIPLDVTRSEWRKNLVSIGNDWLQVVSGLAFGEQCFQQFLRGERLQPEAAQKAVDQIPVAKLHDQYEEMISPQRAGRILQLAEKLPAYSSKIPHFM